MTNVMANKSDAEEHSKLYARWWEHSLAKDAVDTIEALQARVEELVAERIQLAANCEAIRQELARLRALIERNPS